MSFLAWTKITKVHRRNTQAPKARFVNFFKALLRAQLEDFFICDLSCEFFRKQKITHGILDAPFGFNKSRYKSMILRELCFEKILGLFVMRLQDSFSESCLVSV